jgi:hypothetical protein
MGPAAVFILGVESISEALRYDRNMNHHYPYKHEKKIALNNHFYRLALLIFLAFTTFRIGLKMQRKRLLFNPKLPVLDYIRINEQT